MTLKRVQSDKISTYYTEFSCFIAAKNYYFKKNSVRKNSKNEFSNIQKKFQRVSVKNKNHRDNILFKSTNYD